MGKRLSQYSPKYWKLRKRVDAALISTIMGESPCMGARP
jgi:hypothetical protein